jgi:uncharacterized protein YbbC (DUF1343 family)
MKHTFNLSKNTILFIHLVILCFSITSPLIAQDAVVVGANRTEVYLPLLKNKNVAIVANQTSVIYKNKDHFMGHTHLVDSLLRLGVNVGKVFSPEHGFRGQADAGEKVKDGRDPATGLDVVSLYGQNKKPSAESLEEIDVMLFDIQDVGVRFYTYIATLQLVMQACGEAQIPIIILDRPNPNAHYVDGPLMEKQQMSFLGMTPIPLVYGMTIGEYANMINTEPEWLGSEKHPKISVVELKNYSRNTPYSLPIRPSPNLPNDKAISLYPSLGLFEGTTINAGRGTEAQFTRFGAPELKSKTMSFYYTPTPNYGSKSPKHQGEICYGQDLSMLNSTNKVDLSWLVNAYGESTQKDHFFLNSGFTAHAGNSRLQKQIEAGMTVASIEETWQKDLEKFKKIRAKYLRYK